MNFWKQTTHVMSYFKEENFRGDKRLPSSFMEGFLEVCCVSRVLCPVLSLFSRILKANITRRAGTRPPRPTLLYIASQYFKGGRSIHRQRGEKEEKKASTNAAKPQPSCDSANDVSLCRDHTMLRRGQEEGNS